jgi:hypothetical protein
LTGSIPLALRQQQLIQAAPPTIAPCYSSRSRTKLPRPKALRCI